MTTSAPHPPWEDQPHPRGPQTQPRPSRSTKQIVTGIVLIALTPVIALSIGFVGMILATVHIANSASPINNGGTVTLSSGEQRTVLSDVTAYCEVFGPDGKQVNDSTYFGESLKRGEKTYESLIRFTASSDGHYTVKCFTTLGTVKLLVASPMASILTLPWIITGIAGAILLTAGIIVLVRRPRAHRPS